MRPVKLQYETNELIVKEKNLVKIAKSAKLAEVVKIVSSFSVFVFRLPTMKEPNLESVTPSRNDFGIQRVKPLI